MEAVLLAGGKAERLGAASGGLPKPLVEIAGRPLAAYQVGRLAAAGVKRVIVSCAGGSGELFRRSLSGLGPEIVAVEEPERLGRGGGIRFGAKERRNGGEFFALNGDELVDLDFGAMLTRHRESGASATVAVARPPSSFGVVELDADDRVLAFEEAAHVPYWVNCGVYVLGEAALERFPERGDHETTVFPELVSEGALHAYRHQGLWLTVNTPKDLRRAEEYVAAHPEWLRA